MFYKKTINTFSAVPLTLFEFLQCIRKTLETVILLKWNKAYNP